jgi:hypothetical protein
MTKTEFMSLGVKIVISSHEIGEGKSKIQMEVQRVIGSFDQSYEVTKANEHLNSVTKAISQFLQNPGIDLTSSNENVQDNGEKSSQTSAIVGAIVLGLLVIWILA